MIYAQITPRFSKYMNRGSQLLEEIDRLNNEVNLVYTNLVLPGWGGPQHGFPDTLYGYIMGGFSRIDLASAYWRGPSKSSQTERMVSFMTKYTPHTDRLLNSLAVKVWRHTLMHTTSPRSVTHRPSGLTYRWLLHWGDDHLPRTEHFKLQPNGQVFNLSLLGLIDDIRESVASYVADLQQDAVLASNYDEMEHFLGATYFKTE